MQILAAHTQATGGHTVWAWPAVGIHAHRVGAVGSGTAVGDGGKMLHNCIAVWWLGLGAGQNKYSSSIPPPGPCGMIEGCRDWTHSCLWPLSVMDEAAAEHQWHTWCSLIWIRQCVCVCPIYPHVCIDRMRRQQCVWSIQNRWCRLVIFRGLDNRLSGTKEEICFPRCSIELCVGEVLSVQLFQLPGRFSFLR